MIKVVSIWLAFSVLATQLGWRPDSVHTDVIAAESKLQVDDSVIQQAPTSDHQDQPIEEDASDDGDAVDDNTDSETGTPEDKPLNPILARAALPDMSGRLTRPASISRELALSIRPGYRTSARAARRTP